MRKPRKLHSRKAGLPPGVLIPIGEAKLGAPTLSIIDYGPEGMNEALLPDVAALHAYSRQGAVLWVNVYGLPDPVFLTQISALYGLHPLVQEDILNTDQRQKLDGYDNYLYIVLHRYLLSGTRPEIARDQISLVIGHDLVLTFQERQSSTFEPVRERLRANRGSLRRGGADTLAYSLLDSVVDGYFSVIERLNDYAETLESEVLGKPSPAVLEDIHQLKRSVSQLRRNLYPLREVLGALHRDVAGFFRSEVQIYLRDVHDHTVHILESLDDLRELASGLLDVYLSTVSHRVNLEVRTLTVVTTLFMPATLIAGIFGMNFRQMPWLENPRGFFFALGLMLVVGIVMVAVFWPKRGIGGDRGE